MLEDAAPKEDLLKGALAGLVAAALCAGAWAGIALVTDRQFGIVAIGLAVVIGLAVRWGGRGRSMQAGIVGALCAALTIAAGNLLAVAVLVSRDVGVPILEILAALDFDIIWEVLTADFGAADALFYAFALYEGFRFAIVPTPAAVAPAPQAPVA